jgi:hypothetical protein
MMTIIIIIYHQIEDLDDILAASSTEVSVCMRELPLTGIGVVEDCIDFDGDGFVSSDELFTSVHVPFDAPFYFMHGAVRDDLFFPADDVSFTRGHAQLAVMMADRDGDGKLSMAEMRSILDGSYTDDMMMPDGTKIDDFISYAEDMLLKSF